MFLAAIDGFVDTPPMAGVKNGESVLLQSSRTVKKTIGLLNRILLRRTLGSYPLQPFICPIRQWASLLVRKETEKLFFYECCPSLLMSRFKSFPSASFTKTTDQRPKG
jgi:hypothetical protein